MNVIRKPNGICECAIALYSLKIGENRIDQNTSVVVIKLAQKDIEKLESGGVKTTIRDNNN